MNASTMTIDLKKLLGFRLTPRKAQPASGAPEAIRLKKGQKPDSRN